MRIFGIAVGLGLGWASAALAQSGWFQHEFGELRSYHTDWMAVCADSGAGQCRILRADIDPGSNAFFDLRLALYRIDGSPDWVLEVMDRNMPATDVQELIFDFGSSEIVVPAAEISAGDYEYGGAVDSVHLRNPQIVADILAKMKAGRFVTVRYTPEGGGDGEAEFSLRGVQSAVRAVQARVLPRQE